MRRTLVTLVGLASLAGSARASLVVLDLKISRDGISWADAIDDWGMGETVHCAIFMSSDTPELIYGMGGATMRLRASDVGIADSVNFAPGSFTGRMPPFHFGAATNAIFRDTANSFRIDAGSDAADANSNAGLTFFQRDPATATPGTFMPLAPSGSKVFAFDIVLNTPDVYRTVMTMDQLARGVAAYFTSSNASRPTLTTDVRFDGASFWVGIPAPGSLAVLAGIAGFTRRRVRA